MALKSRFVFLCGRWALSLGVRRQWTHSSFQNLAMPSFFAVHVARQGGEGDVPPVPEIRGPEVLGLEFDRWETLYLADADENAAQPLARGLSRELGWRI